MRVAVKKEINYEERKNLNKRAKDMDLKDMDLKDIYGYIAYSGYTVCYIW